MRERRSGSTRWGWASRAQEEVGANTAREVTTMIRRAAKDVEDANARLASLVALRDAMKRGGARTVGDLPDAVRAEHHGVLRPARWI
jgi:hypothetical protein